MANSKILLILFILVALLQLYIPAKMILDREDILNSGKTYKFKTEPIDPNDPFRGKYVALNFENDSFEITDSTYRKRNKTYWNRNETVYLSLIEDKRGFAKINSVSKIKPENLEGVLKAKIRNESNWHEKKILYFDLPFDRYYMEESKAYEAEQIYWQGQRDTSQIAYALVSIKNAEAVLKDVFINETSIKEIVKNRLKQIETQE